MANVKIIATGSTYTGTSAADTIQFASGALKGSTILSEGGNDTINLTEAPSVAAAGYSVQAGDGADSIYVAGGKFSNSAAATLYGNAGNDTIRLGGATVQQVYGQDGNDRLEGSAALVVNTVALGKNADELVFSGTISSSLGLGRGHDKVSASTITFGATTASFMLGEGRDTVNALNLTYAGSANTFLGDAGNGTNAGADSIVVEFGGNTTALKFNAGGGNDTIGFSGTFASANLAFGKGDDKVNLYNEFSGNTTVGGGQGSDTITIGATLDNTAWIKGGVGNDSIALAASTVSGQALTSIEGGAGSDTIQFGVQNLTGTSTTNTLFLSALSDSNLAATDLVAFGNKTTTGNFNANFNFNNSASTIVVGTTTGVAIFGSVTNKATVANGVVSFSGTLSTDAASSITAAMTNVDKLTLNSTLSNDGEGTAVVFTANSKTYLFMQGGTAGVADDGLIQLSAADTMVSLSINGSAALVTYTGA